MRAAVRRLLTSVGWWDALARRGPARTLGLLALVDAGGTGLVAVCLPFFAVTVAGLSAGGLAVALGAAGACELLAAVPNGAIAGRVGVRRFTFTAKLVEAAVYCVLPFTSGLAALAVVAAVGGLARAGANGLFQSLTVAVLGEAERSSVLGAVRALRNIGYLLSGGLGALVLSTGSATALRVAVLCNGLSFLYGAWAVSRLRPGAPAALPERTDWSVLRDAEYLGLIVTAAVFGSSLVVLDVGLPLWALRHDNIPTWSVGTVVMVNTLIVVFLQFRFSRRVEAVRDAVGGIWRAAAAFCVMAALLALTPLVPTAAAVTLLLLAAVALTFGELLESPSWWTLSYELAPAQRKDQYLAAFDLSWALVAIAGPVAMAGLVALGSAGWGVDGGCLLAAAAAGTALTRRRSGRAAARLMAADLTGESGVPA